MKNNPSRYADAPENFGNDTVLQSTLREVQMVARDSRVWIGIAAVVAVPTVIGPFGTDRFLGHAERFVYWAVEAVLTFFTGLTAATAAHIALERLTKKEWLSKALGALAPAIPVSLVVFGTNAITFGTALVSWENYLTLLGNCLVISIAITVIYYQLRYRKNDVSVDEAKPQPVFFKRLPVELGRNLLHISSQDHYVEAVTERGSHLVLMRFADALAELQK